MRQLAMPATRSPVRAARVPAGLGMADTRYSSRATFSSPCRSRERPRLNWSRWSVSRSGRSLISHSLTSSVERVAMSCRLWSMMSVSSASSPVFMNSKYLAGTSLPGRSSSRGMPRISASRLERRQLPSRSFQARRAEVIRSRFSISRHLSRIRHMVNRVSSSGMSKVLPLKVQTQSKPSMRPLRRSISSGSSAYSRIRYCSMTSSGPST